MTRILASHLIGPILQQRGVETLFYLMGMEWMMQCHDDLFLD